nr:unnamed protein product [Callosobruchus chinensis]
MASISQSTLKQHVSGLKLWWVFCASKNSDPYLVSAVQVLDFLTLQFNKGASYSSLNTYRSSLAQIAPDLSHDFRIHKFFKGVYMLRPAMPKYQNTWDPAVVLDYTGNLKNSDISLNILSKKLITLLALATGQRLQTLASIEIDNIHRSDMKIDIPIPRRIKTSARNKFQPFLILPFLNSDPENCVASTLLYYLEKTKLLRGSIKSLFISITKPYKEISAQTLGRWVKNILEKSGVDTTNFPRIVPDMFQHQPRTGKVLISTRLDFQQAGLKIRKCSLWCIIDPLCQIYHLQKRF